MCTEQTTESFKHTSVISQCICVGDHIFVDAEHWFQGSHVLRSPVKLKENQQQTSDKIIALAFNLNDGFCVNAYVRSGPDSSCIGPVLESKLTLNRRRVVTLPSPSPPLP